MKIDELGPHEAYWETPTPKAVGNSPSTIFAAMGKALSAWEMLEFYVLLLYEYLIKSHTEATRRGFGVIESSRERRNVVREVAKCFFLQHKVSEADRSSFRALLNHIDEASKRRNEIAHGIAITVKIENDDRGTFLCPAMYNAKKRGSAYEITFDDEFGFMQVAYRYNLADIARFTERFGVLLEAAAEFNPLFMRYANPPIIATPIEQGDTGK